MSVQFSVNQYDFEGDKFKDCVLLHMPGDKMILQFEDVNAVKAFALEVLALVPEIRTCIKDRDL